MCNGVRKSSSIIIIIISCWLHRYPWSSHRHFSLSFIASGRSLWTTSRILTLLLNVCSLLVVLLLLSSYVGVHKSTSLMSLSLLLQQCPACLVRLTWIVFVIGGRWLKHCNSIGKFFFKYKYLFLFARLLLNFKHLFF